MMIFDNQLLLSSSLIVLAYLIKFLVIKFVKSRKADLSTDWRLVVNSVRNIVNVTLFCLLFGIWAVELQKFALSIAAFIVAIVLATKEIIQCVVGFVYISWTNPFRVGDWIQTGTFTGEVAQTDWAKVTLLEVDADSYHYTGRTVFIPNSQLMILPIKNLNFMRRYVNHSLSVVKDEAGVNPFIFKEQLLAKALAYCNDFRDVAERYGSVIEARLEIKMAGPDPSIKFFTTELGKIKMTMSIFCPTQQARAIEQLLIEDYLTLWAAEVCRLDIAKQPVNHSLDNPTEAKPLPAETNNS